MADLTGSTIGQYQLVSPLGRGGMAVVYRAFQPGMERYVAVKVITTDQTTDPNFLRRFRQEAKVIAALEHPNILPVYDYGEATGFTYLVMRLITTGTLADQLHGRPVPFDRARAIIAQVGDALDYAHSRGVIHRDIKPSNILLDERGHSLLSDFGIAKMAQAATQFTVAGSFVGTPHYASPEQGLGRDLDARSDLYSLGVVLYEMVTGRQPFVADTPMAVLFMHVQDPLPPPRSLNPAISPGLEQVILRALAKDRTHRYPTAAALTAELTAALSPTAAGATRQPQSAGTVVESQPGASIGTVVEPGAYAGVPRPATQGQAPYGGTRIERAPTVGAPPGAGGPPRPPTYVGQPQAGYAAQPAPARRMPVAGWVAGGCGLLLLLCVLGGVAAAFVPGLIPAGLLGPAASPTALIAPTAGPVDPTSAPPPTETLEPSASPTARATPVPPVGSDNIFVEYILDASGSMLAAMDGTNRWEIARRVLAERVSIMPPDINVGLRVYGHRIPWQGREDEACADIELMVPMRQGGAAEITEILPNLEALGMTPMSESIRLAAEDFTFTPENKNTIILISDGIESCGEDPSTVAKFLQDLGIDFTIHVIGLDVDEATRAQLSQLAQTGKGIYHDANSEQDLLDALGDVEAAAVVPPDATPPTDTPTATPIPTPTPLTPVAGAPLGSVSASTNYDGYPARLGVDGDITTSWFSAGTNFDGVDSVYTWTGRQDDLIGRVTIIGNAAQAVPEFRTGFGFGEVLIQVLDAQGNVVFQESASLAGTPDPDVTVHPNVVGRSVVMIFTGHEAPDCGGFAELQIELLR